MILVMKCPWITDRVPETFRAWNYAWSVSKARVRPEERCGKAVVTKLKTLIALGGSRFSQESETGICEECWKAITEQHEREMRRVLHKRRVNEIAAQFDI